jgi:hypothetical protein
MSPADSGASDEALEEKRPAESTGSCPPVQRFRARLLGDDAARSQLGKAGESGTFYEAAVALAQEWGLHVTRVELETAIQQGKRWWIERHL